MTEKIHATLEEQIALEKEYKKNAERILRCTYEKALESKTAGETKVGGALIDNVFDSVQSNIVAGVFENDYATGGVKPAYQDTVDKLKQLMPEEELYPLCTLVTMNALVSASLKLDGGITSFSNVVSNVSRDLYDEIRAWFFVKNTNKSNATRFKEGVAQRDRDSYKRKYANAAYRDEKNVEVLNRWNAVGFDKESFFRMCDTFIMLALDGSDYFEVVEEEPAKGKFHGVKTICAKTWIIETWLHNVDILAKYAFKYCPCVIPPKPWTSLYDGGYYDVLTKRLHLLRMEWGIDNSFMASYKKRLNKMDMSYLYNVVNALQDTAFTINDAILKTAKAIYDNGGGKAGIDSRAPFPEWPMLQSDDKKEIRKYRRKIARARKEYRARQSRLLRCAIALGAAKKYAKYDTVYFPWNMDYRGRLYPIATEISPQGDDLQKALLAFKNPMPVKDESALRWFYIEGANRAGVDKVSFDDRVKWVEENHDNIIKSALMHEKYAWWMEQDSPFLFLAWCDEFLRMEQYLKEHNGSCVGFKSYISYNYDGTCSGLQHFSTMLRDEIGGKAVNLVPQETVSDIYQIVADKIFPRLQNDALNGTDDGVQVDKKTGKVLKNDDGEPLIKYGTKALAQQWLLFNRAKYGMGDKLSRKIVKRSVMTLAYGSGRYGFAENLKEDIIKPWLYDHADTPDQIFMSKSQAANYLADYINQEVATTVVKAVEGMKWLQKVAEIITKSGEVVQWVTPNGLLVQQNKYKDNVKRIYMYFRGAKHNLYIKQVPTDIDKRGQVQAVSPNFIHSMDACHMQRVITALHAAGCENLFMIHDSFGCDLAHADMMFTAIRSEFRRLYEDKDYLQYFLDNVKFLIEPGVKIPKEPQMGNLDIAEVEHSQYCFA